MAHYEIWNTAKVLADCKLKYYRISGCGTLLVYERRLLKASHFAVLGLTWTAPSWAGLSQAQ